MIRKRKNKPFIFIGIFLILAGMLIISSKYIYNRHLNQNDSLKVEEYFNKTIDYIETNDNVINTNQKKKADSYDYIGILEIPSIEFKRGFVDINSKYNTVKKNIQILKESDMPDKVNGNFMIAAHAGTSRISFFKNLPKLKIKDQAIVYYKNKVYKYELANTYEINKTGVANIVNVKDKSVMTLITCKTKTNKQLVFVFELQEVL